MLYLQDIYLLAHGAYLPAIHTPILHFVARKINTLKNGIRLRVRIRRRKKPLAYYKMGKEIAYLLLPGSYKAVT